MKRTVFILALLSAASPAVFGQRIVRDNDAAQRYPACTPAEVKASEPSPEARREMETKLAEARARYEAAPGDADAVIWLGRRTAYLGRFEEAIRIYTEGIRRHPKDARLYRHRGHRYITLRCFDEAISDLERAARLIRKRSDETEPDGQPNARNIPIGTLHSNVWYHLGLAYYLTGDFERALRAGREGLKVSNNPDRLVSQTYWLYLTLRRMGRAREAERLLSPIRADLEVIENHDYQRLLLMYKGEVSPVELLREASKVEGTVSHATTVYGIGNWYLHNKQPGTALQLFLKIVEGPQVTSFGYLAAESELSRSGLKQPPREKLPVRTIN